MAVLASRLNYEGGQYGKNGRFSLGPTALLAQLTAVATWLSRGARMPALARPKMMSRQSGGNWT